MFRALLSLVVGLTLVLLGVVAHPARVQNATPAVCESWLCLPAGLSRVALYAGTVCAGEPSLRPYRPDPGLAAPRYAVRRSARRLGSPDGRRVSIVLRERPAGRRAMLSGAGRNLSRPAQGLCGGMGGRGVGRSPVLLCPPPGRDSGNPDGPGPAPDSCQH